MCIIAIKNSGTKFPSDETISTMWANNPDGAGFMYTRRNEVIIRKGFMNLASYLTALHETCEEVDPTDTTFILHCRITTHGGTCPECTHPFPITDNMASLRKTLIVTDIGIAHNGIIHSVTPRDKHTSDTQEFIAKVLAPLKKSNRKFMQSKALMQLISNLAGSKLAFLTGDGHIYTVGKFETDSNGMIYSNDGYKPRLWSYPSAGMYTSKGYKPYTYNGASSKYLMVLADAPSCLSSTTFHKQNGDVINPFAHAVDNHGNLYKYSGDTGTYYGVSYKPVEKLPTWNIQFADRYETYTNEQALLNSSWYIDYPWYE